MRARGFRFFDHQPDGHHTPVNDVGGLEDNRIARCRSDGHDAARASETREVYGSARHQHWIGASGARYLHTVHTLLACPELPKANYLLVRRGRDGEQTVLAAGRARHPAGSLNLAEVRRLGATLGATEVHVHLLAGSEEEAERIERDLRLGHIECMRDDRSQVLH